MTKFTTSVQEEKYKIILETDDPKVMSRVVELFQKASSGILLSDSNHKSDTAGSGTRDEKEIKRFRDVSRLRRLGRHDLHTF